VRGDWGGGGVEGGGAMRGHTGDRAGAMRVRLAVSVRGPGVHLAVSVRGPGVHLAVSVRGPCGCNADARCGVCVGAMRLQCGCTMRCMCGHHAAAMRMHDAVYVGAPSTQRHRRSHSCEMKVGIGLRDRMWA
jgi:hypothetical protein